MGDLLITLHGNPSVVLGLNTFTRSFYVFSNALDQTGSRELTGIAALPSNPLHTVVAGDVDNHNTGIQELDECGQIVANSFGTLPDTQAFPLPPISKFGINNRGIVFNPLNEQALSAGAAVQLLDGDPTLYGTIAAIPRGNGTTSMLLATGALVDATTLGAIAADQLGTIYLGESAGSHISSLNLAQSSLVEKSLDGVQATHIQGMVHDGHGHLFVTDGEPGIGHILRVDAATGYTVPWVSDRGPTESYVQLSVPYGITIDQFGTLWAVEHRSSSETAIIAASSTTGQVLDYYRVPDLVEGLPAGGNTPMGISVFGVNLPAVRETCASQCERDEITGCFGGCIPAYWRGDGSCDEGPEWNLNCFARNFDDGDCNPCAPGEVPDCNGQCGPTGWIGDSVCDQGGDASAYNDVRVNYDCAAFRFDEGSCTSCSTGQIADCGGQCISAMLLDNASCQSELACAEHEFDRNQCH